MKAIIRSRVGVCIVLLAACIGLVFAGYVGHAGSAAPPGEDPDDIWIEVAVDPVTICLGESVLVTGKLYEYYEDEGTFLVATKERTDEPESAGEKTATMTIEYEGESYTGSADYTVEECDCQISVGVEDKYYFCYDEGSGSVPVEIDKDCDAPDRKTENMDAGGNFTMAEDGDVWLGDNTVKKWCENCDGEDSTEVFVAKVIIDEKEEPIYECHHCDEEKKKVVSLTDKSECEDIDWITDLIGEAEGHSFTFYPEDQEPGEYEVTASCANLDCEDTRDDIHILGVESIEVRDNGRDAAWDDDDRYTEEGEEVLLLEVVPLLTGKTITCEADLLPDVDIDYPEWNIDGATYVGKEVDFTAANYNIAQFWLFDVAPEIYSIYVCPDHEAIVAAFPDYKDTVTISAADDDALAEFVEAMNTIEEVADKVGSPGSVGVDIGGSFSWENQWQEMSGHRVCCTWEFGGDATAGAHAELAFGLYAAGIPPALVDANAFLKLWGELGVTGSVGVNAECNFVGEGGAFGTVGLDVGAEICAVSGLAKATLKGRTSIQASGTFVGVPDPDGPELYSDTEILAGGADVIYEIEYLWGVYTRTKTWTAWEHWTLYEDKIQLVPW